MANISTLKSMSELGLLQLYADLIEELRDREIIRSANNPVADYAEKVAVERLSLERAGKEEKGYDALDKTGKKYQIKGRRITRHNKSRQLGVIRNLDDKLFDFLVAVIFDEAFNILEIWEVPYQFVKETAQWSETTKAYVFHANPAILSDGKGVERIV